MRPSASLEETMFFEDMRPVYISNIVFELHCLILKTFQPSITQTCANLLFHRALGDVYTSDKAVDGISGEPNMFHSNLDSDTKHPNPYFVVDLGAIFKIWGIVIHPRNPTCDLNRFMGIDVSFG